MNRNSKERCIDAGLSVLEELGGGPISTKTLVAAVIERGLIEDKKWSYHNFTRQIRSSDLFDTSTRGHVRLASSDEGTVVEVAEPDEPQSETEVLESSVVEPETQTVYPGPTLGGEGA